MLGPTIRGDYAAITAWYAAALVAGELGQPAAICYFVARDPDRARHYVTTARNLMFVSGVLVAIAGWFLAKELTNGQSGVTFGYRLMFAACPAIYIAASYLFSLQARAISQWALVRALQPGLYLVGAVGLALSGYLNLQSVLVTLVASTVLQAVVAREVCRRRGLTGGRSKTWALRSLLRYGLTQILANSPTTINVTLDQMWLSQTVSAADLGRYAIAVSLTSLAYPLVTPIGSVLFPRIAAEGKDSAASRALQYRALLMSAMISAGMMVALALVAPVVVRTLFGPKYQAAVPLVWILCPGGVLLNCNQVLGDLLRGRNQTVWVALGQGAGAIATVGLLVMLIPPFGVTGAAIATSVSYAVTSTLLVIALVRDAPDGSWRAVRPRGAIPEAAV